MKRMLSTAVKVMDWSPLDFDHCAQPTESQMRDALARVREDLLDMARPHSVAGWVASDEVTLATYDGGDGLALRGNLVMERTD